MSEQLTLNFESQQAQENLVNAEQINAQAQVDQMESEMSGAYSSLGNRHTYYVDTEGKKQVVKRADALEKADEFVEKYAQAKNVDEVEAGSGGSAELPDEERRAKKEALGDMETDELIQAWAKAELDGDDEIASLAQDELQDQLFKARLDDAYKEEETSEIIDELVQMKDAEKTRLESARAHKADLEAIRNIRGDGDEVGSEPSLFDYEKRSSEAVEVDTEEPKPKLYDYEEMIKEQDTLSQELPSVEIVSVEGNEQEADQKIRLRDRFKRIKNATLVAPTTLPSRLREKFNSLSRGKKIAVVGTGAVALAGVALGTKYGFDLAASNSGDASLTVNPDMLAADINNASFEQEISQAVEAVRATQETAQAVDFSQFELPIDWAMQNGGADAPLDFLKMLGERAAEDGHTVKWLPAVGGGEYAVVDNMTSTEDTLRILSQYKS